MDINIARQKLLNSFPQRYRQHIIDFSNNLSELDVDVLIFTARKSACFFHCLEYLRLWSAEGRIVTTDRLLDHDSGWIENKRIAVIDEVIVSGTSLYRLKTALINAGAAAIKIHALFINKDWFVKDFFDDGTLENSYIELDGQDAQALGTIIVRAFQCLPRPYSIDYPMSGWITLAENNIKLLTSLPGWIFSVTEEQWQSVENNFTGEKLECFRLEPSDECKAQISRAISINPSSIALFKVRTYGRWECVNNTKTYHFRIVPYVILEELKTSDVNEIFYELIAILDEKSRKELACSCRTGKSKLRVIQYVLAARFAKLWALQCHSIGLKIAFVADQRELSFVFPASITMYIASICELPGEAEKPKPIKNLKIYRNGLTEAFSGKGSYDFSAAHYLALSQIFVRLYLDEEIPERTCAKEKGKNYFFQGKISQRGDRLARGKTLVEIQDIAQEYGFDISQNQLSNFIDLAVDAGIIVPITVIRHPDSINETLTRAYRHGEETYIILRDLGLFYTVLQTLAEEIGKFFRANNINPPSGSLGNYLGTTLTEKILVLFVRHAITEGIFPRVYADNELPPHNSHKISVGFDMFGARVTIGDHKPTELPTSNAFIYWLTKNKVLLTAKKGYVVNSQWKNPFGAPDAKHINSVSSFALILASAIRDLSRADSGKDLNYKVFSNWVNRVLVTLTTCESEASTLMSLGAELRKLDSGLLSLGIDGGSNVDLNQLIASDQFVSIIQAMDSGYLKLTAFIRQEAQKNAESIFSALHDRVYKSGWDNIWQAARREQSEKAREDIINRLSKTAHIFLKGLLLVHFTRAAIAPRAALSERMIKTTKAKLEHKIRQIECLAAESLTSNHNSVLALYKEVSKVLAWFKGTLNGMPTRVGFDDFIVTELTNLQARARDQFEWIDSTMSEDGKIASIKEYDSVLIIRIQIPLERWQKDCAAEFGSLESATIKRYHQTPGGPRAYKQGDRNSSILGGSGDFYSDGARGVNGETVIKFLAEGNRGAPWLGYISACIVKMLSKSFFAEQVCFSVVALLGLEDSRKAHLNLKHGKLILSSSAKALIGKADKSNKDNESTYAILVDSVGKQDYRKLFIDEGQKNLRRKLECVARQDATVIEAGGTFLIESYIDGESPSSPPTPSHADGELPPSPKSSYVAWVLIVEDELNAALEILKEKNIGISTGINDNGLIVGDATLFHEQNKVCLSIFISNGQGNMNIGNLLSNICSTDRTKFDFIVVSGICCSFGNVDSLTKVVLPISVLDTQIKRQSGKKVGFRSEGMQMPRRVIQLIRWYLARRDKEKHPGISIIDNATMVSDNMLLKTDEKTERHRVLAKEYSDKAIAYDMESAGVAAWGHANTHWPPAIVIKGMSDLGTSDKKDDSYRLVAAKNAMEVSMDFILISSGHATRKH